MYKILSQWKAHGGYGVLETNDQQAAIRCIEIAINAMADKTMLVIAPSSSYFTYRKYFPNHAENLNNIFSITSRAIKYDVVFIVGIDIVSDSVAAMIEKINAKYRLYIAKDYEKVPAFVSNTSPLLKDENKEHNETNFIIPMSDEVQSLYDRVESTMSDIMKVFRDYDNINYCIAGNGIQNASAFRDGFAELNGWNKDLNIDVPMFAQIDKYYNPDNLFEQATLYNKLVRERESIISKSDDKIKYAASVATVNAKKRIIILVKGDDMCDLIADRINHTLGGAENKIEAINANTKSRPLKDDEGNFIRYKGGAKKGEIKQFGAKSVNDAILSRFNDGKLNMLVTTGTLNKDCIIKGIDLIIVVSPKANNYFKLKARLKRFDFNNAINVVNITFDNDKDIGKFKRIQQSLNLKVDDVLSLDKTII